MVQIKWVEYARTVNVRGYEKQLREGTFMNTSGKTINITVWGQDVYETILEDHTYRISNVATSTWNNQLRIATTATSTATSADDSGLIKWSTKEILSHQTRVCCPEIVSAKKNSYVTCRNFDCRKKIPLVNE